MIRAIALDDEPLALKIIEAYCEKIDFLQLEKTFNKQSDALKYLNKFPVDLIFLVINMPNKNGLDFYKSISQNTKVIFTTAYTEYAVNAFEVNAVDYLVKPFSFERFQAAVEKIKTTSVRNETAFLSIRADYKLHRINSENIVLIEGSDDYVKIHLNNSETITARSSMKNIQEKLPVQDFLRVHRSYIIPLKSIKTLMNKNFHIGEFIIPIGDTYKDEITRLLKN